jgi:hypothetical protein
MLGDLRLDAADLRLCGDIETYSPNKGFTVKYDGDLEKEIKLYLY